MYDIIAIPMKRLTLSDEMKVTIPAKLRGHLGVGVGDKIATPLLPSVPSLRGAAGKLKKPQSWHKMREIAREDHLKGKDADGPSA